jgi:pimeloyl-ACP methyl ester carboxylesterase
MYGSLARLSALAMAIALSPALAAAPVTTCRAAPAGLEVQASPDVRIHVRTIGQGRPILFIPSLARGVADFDEVANQLARQGYMAILPDPRGTGKTVAPAPTSLFDLAHDAAAVAEKLCNGPVDVVGHAFGNRVARSFATSSPALVRSVVLLAGGGKTPSLPRIGNSVSVSTQQGIVPDAQRIVAIKAAFFAEGHAPDIWLTGWYPQAAAYQGAAMKGSTVDQWWAGGTAPILLVQADEDPVAPAGNRDELARDIGTRLTSVDLRHASHAILPEQPAAVTWLLAHYFAGERDPTILQKGTDALTRP